MKTPMLYNFFPYRLKFFHSCVTVAVISVFSLVLILIEWVCLESPVVWTGAAQVVSAELDRGIVQLTMKKLDGSNEQFFVTKQEFVAIWLSQRGAGSQIYKQCTLRNNGFGMCVPSSNVDSIK